MPATVSKLEEASPESFIARAPTEIAPDRRFSVVRSPLLQASDMGITCDETGAACTIICTDEYADFVAAVDAHLATTIATNSLAWFGKNISHDVVERRFAESIRGHKMPKHVVSSERTKWFDHNLERMASAPDIAVATLILRCDGVTFEERRCVVQWTLCQARLAPPPPDPEVDEEAAGNKGEDDDDDGFDDAPLFST